MTGRRRTLLMEAGLVLVAAGAVMIWNDSRSLGVLFEGEMWLSPGHRESYVLAAHDPERPPGTLEPLDFHSNVLVQNLPIPAEAKTLLPSGIRVDAARLPFALMLQSAVLMEAASTEYVLSFQHADRQWEQLVEAGQIVAVDGASIEVESIRPWGGLLREPDGLPMADVAVQWGEVWIEDVFLADGEWVRVGDDVALQLMWNAELSAEYPSELHAARWGVVDGGAMQWTTSFAAGTSFVLRDGRLVSLLGVEGTNAGSPVLSVRVEGPTTDNVQVNVNADGPSGLVHFEDMGRLRWAMVLEVASFERAHLAAYALGVLAAQAPIAVGETWQADDQSVSLRLEQLERSALPLRTSDSPLVEARLMLGDEPARIRQGESMQWRGITVQFRRRTAPSSYVVYVESTGNPAGALALIPDAPVRIGLWDFEPVRVEPRLDGFTVRARRFETLKVSRGDFGLLLAGIVLIAAGAWRRSRRSL